jgi:hypothetical protein
MQNNTKMNTEIHKLITINGSSLHDKCQKNKSKYDRALSVVAGPGAPSFSLPPLAMQPSCGSSPPSTCCLSAHRRLLSCTRSANIQISVSTCDTMENKRWIKVRTLYLRNQALVGPWGVGEVRHLWRVGTAQHSVEPR